MWITTWLSTRRPTTIIVHQSFFASFSDVSLLTFRVQSAIISLYPSTFFQTPTTGVCNEEDATGYVALGYIPLLATVLLTRTQK